MSTVDEIGDELHEKEAERLTVKEEIVSDHENNLELLELDVKKEFELLDKQEDKTDDSCDKSTFENKSHYKCQICEKTFRSFFDYETHKKQHSLHLFREDDTKGQGTKTRARCGFCNKRFESEEILATHHKNVHNELKFSCEFCGKNYLSQYGLNKHIKSMHFQSECDKCKEIFLDRASFKIHRRQHRDKAIKCKTCQKEFDNTKGLDIHVKLQHEQDGTMRTCDMCQKEFINIKLLKRHYGRTHDKCFKCPHCDKAFALRCSFERHFLTHTGAKDYKCTVCGRQFSRQRSLKNHVLLHSDERSFQCDQCPKAFKTQPLLRYHKFSHSIGEQFECAICLQKFKIKLHLIKHINNHNSTVKQYKCQNCTKPFKTRKWYKRHVQRCEDKVIEQKHSCNLCENSLSSQFLLDDHMIQTHHSTKDLINTTNE